MRGVGIGFAGLALGVAVWGVSSTGVLAFWAGWSIAALFVGYVLAFRMDNLPTSLGDLIKKLPGLFQFFYGVAIALFVDVYVLAAYKLPVLGLGNEWLSAHMTVHGLLPFLGAFGLFFAVSVPGIKLWVALLYVSVFRMSPSGKDGWVSIDVLEAYALTHGDVPWAMPLIGERRLWLQELKQMESICLSVVLLTGADIMLGRQVGDNLILGIWDGLVLLPWQISSVLGVSVLLAAAFVAMVAFRGKRQFDTYVEIPIGITVPEKLRKQMGMDGNAVRV